MAPDEGWPQGTHQPPTGTKLQGSLTILRRTCSSPSLSRHQKRCLPTPSHPGLRFRSSWQITFPGPYAPTRSVLTCQALLWPAMAGKVVHLLPHDRRADPPPLVHFDCSGRVDHDLEFCCEGTALFRLTGAGLSPWHTMSHSPDSPSCCRLSSGRSIDMQILLLSWPIPNFLPSGLPENHHSQRCKCKRSQASAGTLL